jgi:hypothetical protein
MTLLPQPPKLSASSDRLRKSPSGYVQGWAAKKVFVKAMRQKCSTFAKCLL